MLPIQVLCYLWEVRSVRRVDAVEFDNGFAEFLPFTDYCQGDTKSTAFAFRGRKRERPCPLPVVNGLQLTVHVRYVCGIAEVVQYSKQARLITILVSNYMYLPTAPQPLLAITSLCHLLAYTQGEAIAAQHSTAKPSSQKERNKNLRLPASDPHCIHGHVHVHA